ncbi:Bug family tripartite tricarboxylate transporter substrate binding protein [Falsirhodobacter halotolerans]|uniref:Bug family tripartite tricarboxylate transporter substrate binding protein n=1 Tax=Falsirhodobacter halotolerans TaxID=1146892 RepID=UPI001FD271E0|nr:tripartite tricarboxylate transporter substrate-binding protein [Falsirhodobacter halotolerans]MCJ8140879.1 tricarboxylate transporter [Falsirhodobacter halotolerans]
MTTLFKPIRALMLCATAALPLSATAQDFAGETVEWTIPFGVGGGTDVWARFFAPQLSQTLPGNPTVIVLNVPGGGSITGANQFHARATDDGLSILGTSASTQYPAILGDPRVRYDYADWTAVLASPTGGVVYADPKYGVTGADGIDTLRAQEIRFASQGATALEMPVLLALKMLELNIRPVFGMESRGAGRLAFERGEAGIDFQTASAYLNSVVPLVESGKAVPLFSMGVVDADGNVSRDPSFPDVPTFVEFYEQAMGAPPEGQSFEAWKALMIAGYSLQKMIVLPKDVPEEVLAAYTDAAHKIVEAPDFRERAGEEIGVYDQLVGEEANTALQNALTVDEDIRTFLTDWLSEDYNVRF